LEVVEGMEVAEGLARKGGVVLRVPSGWLSRDAEQTRQRRWLLAHEIFHRYNGESLYFAEGAPKTARARASAFTEGMTSYVAVLALAQLGWLDAAETEALLVRLTAPTGVREGEGSAYREGVAQSWALDKALRERSGGQRSVQGFWVLLSRLPAYWERPLALSELDQWLTRYGGVGWGASSKVAFPPDPPLAQRRKRGE
jgi:predicted metalloprotease with PDZ domain